jgi:hypothetical protein
MAGKYHFSRDIVFNENTPGHLSPQCGLPTNLALLPPPSILPEPLSDNDHQSPSSIPHTAPNPLPTLKLTDVIHTRTLIDCATCSTTNSLPKPTQHYNDIDSVNLSISMNTINDLTPSKTPPDPFTQHSSLLHDCFLSAPLLFLHNCSWDLSKPPNSYHKATTRPDHATWLAAMQQELESLEKRKVFERTTLPPGRKAVGVRWTYGYKYNPDGTVI